MVKLPCYLILCQCYLDTYNWCHVTLLPEMFFHCYLVTCPKYPMLPCYLKTVNRPHGWAIYQPCCMISQPCCMIDQRYRFLKCAQPPVSLHTSNPNIASNYRPITVSSIFSKLLKLIILPNDVPLQNNQFGFRAGYSVSNGINLLNDLICYNKYKGSNMYIYVVLTPKNVSIPSGTMAYFTNL